MNRPPSAMRQTVSDPRLGTAARRGSATMSQVRVEDRPMTQHGLGGIRTSHGARRQVEDRPYWLGVLRSKINETTSEITRIQRQMLQIEEESGNYLTYQKTAERMAAQIRDLQAELSDYNTLVEKATSSDGFTTVEMECEQLHRDNERSERELDALFEQKQRKELASREIEARVREAKLFEQRVVERMDGTMKKQYMKLKHSNETLLSQISEKQSQVTVTQHKIDGLSREIRTQPFKNEALVLYEQLYEQEAKRAQMQAELKQYRSPKEEKDQLLAQIKTDNQEISLIERQLTELEQRLSNLQDESRALQEESDESAQLERRQRLQEMRQKEQQIDEFLQSYEVNTRNEKEKTVRLEAEVVLTLEEISRSLKILEQAGVTATSTGATNVQLPNSEEFEQLKEMLKFKGEELKKSEQTSQSLLRERTRKQEELQKVELLEGNMKREIQELKDKIAEYKKDLVNYNNVDRAVREHKDTKERLQQEKVNLERQVDLFKVRIREMSSRFEAQKAQLVENETYAQLMNLERKLAHSEQNNYAIKEYVDSKSAETNYEAVKDRCVNILVKQLNKSVQDSLSGVKRI